MSGSEKYQSLRVLIAEDDEMMLRSLKRYLENQNPGIMIFQATDGQSAVEILTRQTLDCAFLDYQMPNLNGLEALKQAKAAGVKTPIIIVTGQGDESLAVEMMKAGATDYLAKGTITSDKLAQSLSTAVRIARAERRAELALQQLAEAHRELEAIFQSAPLAIFMLDRDSRIIKCNTTALKNWGEKEHSVIGKSIFDVGSDTIPSRRSIWSRVIKGEPIHGEEIMRRLPDGSERHISLYSTILRDRDGQIDAVLVLQADITESRRLKQQLLHSQRMESIGRLAGGIAHDFNNLLAIISTYSESILRKLPADDAMASKIQQIEQAAQRGAGLTQRLLTFSRRQDSRPRRFDLRELVNDLADMLRQAVGDRIHLTITRCPQSACVLADPGQVEQALLNLVINARDAIDQQGGRIEVDVSCREDASDIGLPGRCAVLSVRDNGRGMDASTQERMFEPFFTTKGNMGTGLGLSIVYGVVEQAGGRMRVESEPGKGSVLQVLLPCMDESASV